MKNREVNLWIAAIVFAIGLFVAIFLEKNIATNIATGVAIILSAFFLNRAKEK